MRKKNSIKSNPGKITPRKFFSLQWKVFKELLENKKLWTIGIIIFSILINICSLVEMKFLEFATDSVYGYYRGEFDFKNVTFVFSVFFVLLLLIRFLSNVYNKIKAKYNSNVSLYVDKKITSKIASISYEYFETTNFYEKIHLAAKASVQYPNAVYGLTQIVNIICSLVVYCYILSELNFIFVVIVLASVFIGIIVSTKTTDRQLEYWRDNVSPEERKNNYFRNIYSNRVNQNNIQIKGAYTFFSQKYHEYNESTRKNYLKLNKMSFVTEMAVTLLFILSFLLTAITVSQKIVQGELNLGFYTMVIAALANLFNSIKKFVGYMTNTNWYIKVLEAYYEVLNFDENVSAACDSGKDIISLENISYQYAQSNAWALSGVNITFTENNKIAIVGANGSGKSTCVLIVLEMLKNYIGTFSKKEIVCTAVLQNFMQYQMTIKQNIEIGVGGKSLSDEKIISILKKVGLHDYVMAKTNNIHTILGQLEKGEDLSIGQWQRLAIARLLANENAKVWILDEPTAHLDPIAEIETYRLIFDLAKDKLVIFISHRLGFARMADNIIVFNNGKVEEVGNHEELMEQSGLYKQMFEVQKEMYF